MLPRKTSVLILTLLLSSGVFAHHAMEVHYLTDEASILSKEGVVKKFSLLDPHSYLVVSVEENGEMKDWVLEAQSRVMLTRSGWRFDMLKLGTTIRFTAFPARTGERAGRILTLEVDGEIYCSDRCDLTGVEMQEISESNQAASRFAEAVVPD